MNIQPEILELEQLGRMPDESDDTITEEQINKYAQLLEQIKKPINLEEANVLVKIFPITSLYGVEFTLLHVFESVLKNEQITIQDYESLILNCPSIEWQETLNERLK